MAKSIKKEDFEGNAFEKGLSGINRYYNHAFQIQALMAHSENGFYTCFLIVNVLSG